MENLTKEKVLEILENPPDAPNQGFLFEVDLNYPKDLWREHNDYPLAPEKKNYFVILFQRKTTLCIIRICDSILKWD